MGLPYTEESVCGEHKWQIHKYISFEINKMHFLFACKLPTNLITDQKQIGKGHPSVSAFIGRQEETTRVIFFSF